MVDGTGETICGDLLYLDHYQQEEIYAGMHWIEDPKNDLHNTDEAHWRALGELSWNYMLDYESVMMKMYIFATVKMDGVTLTFADHNTNEKRFMKNGYRMVMLDRRYWRNSVRVLRDKNSVEWAIDSMCVCYAFQLDKNPCN